MVLGEGTGDSGCNDKNIDSFVPDMAQIKKKDKINKNQDFAVPSCDALAPKTQISDVRGKRRRGNDSNGDGTSF